MSTSADISITSQCIHDVMHIGHTTYYNICTNAPPIDIGWGIGDWVMGSLMAVTLIAAAVFFGGMGASIIRNI